MTKNDIFSQIVTILHDTFDIEPNKVQLDSRLYDDLDIDSIDAVDLIVRLREITGKQVPPDRFKSVRTIGDVIGVLETL